MLNILGFAETMVLVWLVWLANKFILAYRKLT
jgi:hypothetical protein